MCLVIGLFTLLSLLLSLSSANAHPELSTFYITGLFPTESSNLGVRNTLGIYPRAAARYTVQRINQLGLLAEHNVTLKLEAFDSGCQGIASGAHGLIQAVQFAKERGLHDNSAGEKYYESGYYSTYACTPLCKSVGINRGTLTTLNFVRET